MLPERIRELIRADLPSLLALYRDLHAHPEISGEEAETAGRLAAALSAAGCRVTGGIGGHGIVGVLENGAGPVVMLRADMDALPVAEETGLPYASQRPGVMHACGHDVHMTALVGAARLLAATKERWRGTVLFVGQPAEEIAAGARLMIADGLFSRFPRPDCAVAVHVGPDLPVGTVGSRGGILSAGGESIDLVVRGIGGHAAHPDRARDPILLAAQTVLALQAIRSREIDPNEFFILSTGAIHGGRKHNAIPDEVVLKMSMRYHTRTVQEQGLAAIRRIAEGTAVAAGIPPALMPTISVIGESAPPLYTDTALTEGCAAAIRACLGAESTVEIPPLSGSEDFAVFGEEGIPLAYFRIGTKEAGDGGAYLHSSRFAPRPEAAVETGAIVLAVAAIACAPPE
ncbi:amidohydrolase [Methanofollis liminatans DSM 4140]|uniref:Amidohydrolase n=1 Tax=Methanofollis liminatans DSM 4140 TaxID=28892 RepID=J1ANG5_9EURY|nr:amidohydrolase [Methanofollis liminatans]EJG06383.1 amidohydrolase [Methanofollis liminatans DSM 4140]